MAFKIHIFDLCSCYCLTCI